MRDSIVHLPYDLLHDVASYLRVREYTSVSLVNQQLHHYLQSQRTARSCLEANAADPIDQRQLVSHRQLLSRIHDRDEALRTANPYSVSLLANATSFMFESGVLCYSTNDAVRILDLTSGEHREKVISARYFGQRVAVPGSSAQLMPSEITILGYRDSIITIRCDFDAPRGTYLFALNVQDHIPCSLRLLLCEPIRSANKLFCVHNSSYLYYGTHSVTGSHSHHEWLIQGFNLAQNPAEPVTPQPVQLRDFAGSDLGSTVAFTIEGDQFIAISTQVGFETDEINWTSYYRYVQFPLSSTKPDITIKTIFRRQDIEGPINDAWADLHFSHDYFTGELLLVESRKEWLSGGSTQTRTWYVEPWNRAEHGEWGNEPTINPADRLSSLHDPKENSGARYQEESKPRIDKYCHREYSEGCISSQRTGEYLRAKTKWIGYDYNCCKAGAFVDLVVDEVDGDDGASWRKKETLGLRIASRLPKPPLEFTRNPGNTEEGVGRLRQRTLDKFGNEIPDSDERFTESEIFKWPPQGTQLPREVQQMMCPGGKAGHVKAKLGFEGLIYMAGTPNEGGERNLVLLSFDPRFGFEGMKRLDGTLVKPRNKHGSGSGTTESPLKRAAPIEPGDEETGQVKRQRLGLGPKRGEQGRQSPVAEESIVGNVMPSTATASVSSNPPKERFLWREQAMYLKLKQGWWLR